MHVLAVDIGGTKIAAARIDDDGAIHARSQVATPTGGPEALMAAVLTCVGTLEREGIVAVGVGCAGPFTAHGRVSPVNIEGWRDYPLQEALADQLALPVTLAGDGQALALAESWRGAARGARGHLGMVVSTGVGGGLVLDGRLLTGGSGNAGHLGHVAAVTDGAPCGCGGHGCLEAEISGSAWQRRTGSPAAHASCEDVERAGAVLGRVLADVTTLLDLDVVTIGGSVALGFGEPFFAAVRAQMQRRALDFARRTVVSAASLGADAPLVGAAALGLGVHLTRL